MSNDSSLNIQNQIRENSDDLQNFLRDLGHWEKDMKRKEEEIKQVQFSGEKDLPPIRNTVSNLKKARYKKQKHRPHTSSNTQENKEKNIGKCSKESELVSSDDSSSSNEEKLEIQKKKQLALLKKDKGNDFFKQGNYDSAINCYTAGMGLDPHNPLLPANRAMAFIKKEQFQSAENDCSLCLSVDPTYVKAYLRRGTSRLALHKEALARDDFLKVLELEPENRQAQTEIEKLNKLMNGTNHLGEELKTETPSLDSHSLPSAEHKYMQNVEKSISEKSLPISIHNGVGEKNKEDSKSREKACIDCDFENPMKEIEDVITLLEQTLPPVPNAAFQFLTDWEMFKKYPDMKYEYLKQFPPDKLPIVFKHAMEAEIFPEILHILSTYFINNGDDVVGYMEHLTQVGRFNTMLMFLSKEEKKDLKRLLEFIKGLDLPSAHVDKIVKMYTL